MSIHISTTGHVTPASPAGQRLAATIGASTRAQAPTTRRAVAISPAAQQLANLQSGDADVNTARVATIRAAITAGKLPVDTGRIADGLIQSARELLAADTPRAHAVK